MEQQRTISQLDCDVWRKVDVTKLVTTSSVVGPRKAPKHFPKPKLHQKKVTVTVWWSSGQCDLSESWRNHYIWEVGSANWWDAPKTARPPASIGQQNGPSSSPWQHPTAHCTSNTSEVEQIRLWNFAPPAIFTWPFTNQPWLLQASWQLFAGKTLLQLVGDRKCLPRVCEFWRKDFYATGVNKLISHWQKCVNWNGSYFVNKDVFEPSFNDLKFTALNRDCFCINLI